MAGDSHVTIEVRMGPILAAAEALLRAVDEHAELIPDWHADERSELRFAAARLEAMVADELRRRAGGGGENAGGQCP